MYPVYLLFLIISVVCNCYCLETQRHFRKETFDRLYKDVIQLIPKEYDGLFNARCTFPDEDDRWPKIICNFTVEAWPLPDRTINRNCSYIDIYAEDSEWKMLIDTDRDPSFHSINKENVLFKTREILKVDYEFLGSYKENSRDKFTIINMTTCAKTSFTLPYFVDPEEIGYRSLVSSPVIYNNEFSVFVTSKTICAGYDKCRLAYDFKGNRIGDPKPYFADNLGDFYSVADSSPDKGFYMLFNRLQRSLRISSIDPAGRSKELLTRPETPGSISRMFAKKSITSNAHGLFSYCQKLQTDGWIDEITPSRSFRCLQFDTTTTRLNVTLELPEATAWVAIRNLADGGILFASMSCRKVLSKLTGMYEFPACELQILTIRDDGNQYKPLKLRGFEFKNSDKFITQKEAQIVELENEFCFVFACEAVYDYSYYKSCVEKKNVSVSDMKILFSHSLKSN